MASIVGYNVQTAIDSEHHLIVAHEVVNQGHDREQLASMAEQAKEATGKEKLEVLAANSEHTEHGSKDL